MKHKNPQRCDSLSLNTQSLLAMLDSMEDRIYVVDRDYRIRFMNWSLRRDMGEGEGALCYAFFGHDPQTCDECQHGMSSFEPERRREWVCPADGRVYEVSVSPLHGPDGSIFRLHIMRDISQRKALEAALQEQARSLEAKVREQAQVLFRQERLSFLGEIAAGLAHELRTPLGAILTGVKLLEKASTDSDQRTVILELIGNETQRLERKLSEFLRYARGRLPEKRLTPVQPLLEDVGRVLATDAVLRGDVRIHVHGASNMDPFPMDADLIKEVLLNLGQNALQALSGKGELHLEARSTPEGLEILVRDNGPGIPSGDMVHVFKPFFTRRSSGTGLGLAVCKDIVEAHGGRISVSSLPHVQTTFRIILPR
ncbi:MAG: two-component system sensor histidine kinase NtrB [Desulfosoma sp.]|uniref:two-component system sensor histidine kinase NtrB n=1 Tax=Desulfosoma sp. TaxID=2603217 RepID=UPI00404A5798